MELAKGLSLDYENGDVVMKYKLSAIVLPWLESMQSKIEAGQIDLIKGTELDKMAMIQAITMMKAELSK